MNYNAALNRLANSYFAQPPGACLSRWYDCISGCIFFTSRLRGACSEQVVAGSPLQGGENTRARGFKFVCNIP